MAKKSSPADSSTPDEAKVETSRQKNSALLDTRVIYCGDSILTVPNGQDSTAPSSCGGR